MHLTFLSASAEVGGAERSLLDLAASARAGAPEWRISLVSPGLGALAHEAQRLGIEVHSLPFPATLARLGDSTLVGSGRDAASVARVAARAVRASAGTARHVSRLRALLRRLAPDLVHSNGLKTHVLTAWARPAHSALVWQLHDYLSPRPAMARLLRALASRCDVAVGVSQSVSADARATLGERVAMAVVLNAVDLARFTPEGTRLDLDATCGMPAAGGVVRIGLVATAGRFKGHETFLRAIAQLPRELDVRAYVVGGAIYKPQGSEVSLEELRALARTLGIENRVGFTGFVSAPEQAMRALDVVVHASTAPEPFGLVIAEGMACGRAVVTSALGGAAELVRAGQDALTHAAGDPASLAAQLERLAREPSLRARLGEAARRSAEQRFDRARLVGEWRPLYASAIERRARAA